MVLPRLARAAAGGLLVGLVLRVFPEVYGAGFDAMESALRVRLPWKLLLRLFVAAPAANYATLGSGRLRRGGAFRSRTRMRASGPPRSRPLARHLKPPKDVTAIRLAVAPAYGSSWMMIDSRTSWSVGSSMSPAGKSLRESMYATMST